MRSSPALAKEGLQINVPFRTVCTRAQKVSNQKPNSKWWKPTKAATGNILLEKQLISQSAWRNFTTDATVQQKSTPTKRLSFQASASYSAKGMRYFENANTFNFNPYHRVKTPEFGASESERRKSRPDSGQDAFFISRLDDSGGIAIGVADGVGGYSHYGIDSADFSHTLCENMALVAHTHNSGNLHPRTLLYNAYQNLIESRQVRGGASTACVGTIRPDGVMMVANLGDSGFIILRHGKVQFTSSPQTHAFNTPYQLSVVPPEVLDQSRMFGGDFLCDLPKDAQVTTHALENGDVVIFATDGVWDNLFPQDILRIVSQEMVKGNGWSSGPYTSSTSEQTPPSSPLNSDSDSSYESSYSSPKSKSSIPGISPTPDLARVTSPLDGTGLHSVLARAITWQAKSASLNRRVDGPFAKEVKRLMPGEQFSGGKRDDICVVCLVVVEEES
ncbi:phosphatase 2C-like domain-containing protein [Kalaharituber pfeilii]|nr:phosphatase 2C-like domain-containing protein [Kalaharituber pfeilii]